MTAPRNLSKYLMMVRPNYDNKRKETSKCWIFKNEKKKNKNKWKKILNFTFVKYQYQQTAVSCDMLWLLRAFFVPSFHAIVVFVININAKNTATRRSVCRSVNYVTT